MPEFVLDTSGRVAIHGRRSTPNPAEFTAWEHLDSFTQGYIEALFFTEGEPSISRDDDVFINRGPSDAEPRSELWEGEYEGEHKAIPGDYGFADLAPETLAQIIEDCREFQASDDAGAVLFRVYESDRDYSPEQAGRDFWFTRNGHGVGFWDRADLEPGDDIEGNPGEELSAAARKRGEVWAHLGDDGRVHS